MSDDLRLRTAKAMGWRPVSRQELTYGLFYERWRHPNGLNAYLLYHRDTNTYEDDPNDPPLPLYGTDWASCEEIDAAIKEREWEWSSVMTRHGIKVEVDLPHGKLGARCWDGLGTATAPIFPEAFAEAFCKAVEANDGH